MAWVQSLPSGVLNQWLAFDSIEPIGEDWMQTAKILEALYLPIYAKAGHNAPDASDLMPDRFTRPKKSVLSEILGAAKASSAMAEQFKAMIGATK